MSKWDRFNLQRPYDRASTEGKSPFSKVRELGCDLPEEFALFPPLVLDRISADWALAWPLRGGNDLLAHHSKGLSDKGHSPPGMGTLPGRGSLWLSLYLASKTLCCLIFAHGEEQQS